MTFLLIGGKPLSFLFQSLVRIPRIIQIINKPWFSDICKDAFSTDAFTSVRCKVEKQNINVSSDSAEVYNRHFSVEELRDALREIHDTSAGPDEIHYKLLNHLPSSYLLFLLNLF